MKILTRAVKLGLIPLLVATGVAADTIDTKARSEKVDALLDPAHPAWSKWSASKVTMLPQNIAKPNLDQPIFQSLEVKAAVTKGWLCLRLEWEDKSRDAEVTKGLFTDACAVEFAAKGDAKDTSPFMGNPGKPVHIIHWKAIWQDDVQKGYRDIEHAYPNAYYDYYPLAKGKRAQDISGPALVYNPARYLKNPISDTLRREPVEELVAEGFGSSTSQKHLDARANGSHQQGKWSVVIARPLTTPDPTDAQLKGGTTIPIAFALWDGATKNRGARKHFAMWTDLKIAGQK